jgi:hypothetical protein
VEDFNSKTIEHVRNENPIIAPRKADYSRKSLFGMNTNEHVE